VAVVVRRGRRVLLVQCAEGGRWAGLWDFPRFAVTADDGRALAAEVVALLRGKWAVTVRLRERLPTLKHSVTRFRITLDCYAADYVSGKGSAGSHWLEPHELVRYPLSTTGRKIAEKMSQ
jgi:A/G-specific adenine glycosylase